jgi:undecaprenyl-diphosphatase
MDQQIQILINREWTAPWSDRLFSFIADYGAWAPWLLLLMVLALVLGNFRFRAAILAAGLAVGLSDGIGVNLLKHAVGRPRPSQEEPGVRLVSLGDAPANLPRICGLFSQPVVKFPLGYALPEIPGMMIDHPPPEGRSFPSGHAANNMAVAVVLILFFPRFGWLYLPIALLIGYSRVYTGSHWPLDVMAGMILGLFGGVVATRILNMLWLRLGKQIMPQLACKYPNLLPMS